MTRREAILDDSPPSPGTEVGLQLPHNAQLHRDTSYTLNSNASCRGTLVNPRHACAARVTVLSLSVCLSLLPR